MNPDVILRVMGLLKAAEFGSRNLDLSIERLVAKGGVIGPDGVPHYTTSLDAALTLVPEDWNASVNTEGHVCMFRPHPETDDIEDHKKWISEQGAFANLEWFFRAASPALALCIGCLKARAYIDGK